MAFLGMCVCVKVGTALVILNLLIAVSAARLLFTLSLKDSGAFS